MKLTLLVILLTGLPACMPVSSPVTDPGLRPDRIRTHVRFLAGDLLEGRLPGTRGGELAAGYIAAQFELAGLRPAHGDSYYQMVPLVGIKAEGNPLLGMRGKQGALALTFARDYVIAAGVEQEKISLRDRELVFVGYGITAPEVPWDDYKGIDLRGKVLLMLVNDPPSEDPRFFGGRALTYYGRWTYKLEEAARQGAAGALLIHNTDMAGYPWGVVESSWTGEQFSLPQEQPQSMVVEGWVQESVGDQLLASAGLTFQKARELAAQAAFKPVPLGLTVSLDLASQVRRIESPNVIARLEGSDHQLKEEVILITSHYDHLGVGQEVNGDAIYNGALDNASGTAGLLELAARMAAYAQRPRRSILLAAVTAEEQGLLGSEYYATHPLVPLAKTAANINFDSINVWGKTENLTAMGAERSTIEAVVERVAQEMNLVLSPDAFPEKGYFFRSDQFNLVKVGVPAVYVSRGYRYIGKPEGWGEELAKEYTAQRYHRPSDEFDSTWSFEGAAQMMEFAFRTALYLANQEDMPVWKPGDAFEAIRKKTLTTDR